MKTKYLLLTLALLLLNGTIFSQCPQPTLNNNVTTTTNTATVTWTAGDPSQTLFDLYWSTINVSPTTATTPSVANLSGSSYTIEGLPINTSYHVWIRANCGTATKPEPSDWSPAVSFTTPCGIHDLPYYCDFESGASNPLQCWTILGHVFINEVEDGFAAYLQYSHSGLHYCYNASRNCFMVLPLFTESLNNLHLDFWIRPGNAAAFEYGTFDVGYITDLSDTSTFVTTNTYNWLEFTSNEFVKKSIDFNGNNTPSDAHIAFRVRDCNTTYWRIDDLSVQTIPNCATPTNLSVTDITTSSARLSWTPNDDETSWTIHYKKYHDEDYSQVTVNSSNYTLNGLDGFSRYEYFVVANCSPTEHSLPSDVFTFDTKCNISISESFTYKEGFEDYPGEIFRGDGVLPVGWKLKDSYNAHITQNFQTQYAPYYYWNTGVKALLLDNNARVMLPEFNNASLNGIKVSLWAFATGECTLHLGYWNGSYHEITSWSVDHNSTLTHDVTLDNLPDNVRLMIYADVFPEYCFIDDVKIELLCNHPTPTDFSVDYTDENTAIVRWSSDAPSYNILVNGQVIQGVTSSPYTINDLELSTTYTVQVQGVYGNEASLYTDPKSFTTRLCLPEDRCFLTFELHSQDGWRGNVIKVVDVESGTVIGMMESTFDDVQYTLDVCDGRQLQFLFQQSDYADQVSYAVYEANGDLIFQGSGPFLGPINHTVNCNTCIDPYDLNTPQIGEHVAGVEWNGTSESYQLQYRPILSLDTWNQVGDNVISTAELSSYTFDLSGYGGTGNIAIRHYNVSDQYRLIVDNIRITNAQGTEILFEDFEDNAIPTTWINNDKDGDGHLWETLPNGTDANANPYCNGDYCASSASWIPSNPELTPDNWLIIPNVALGGTLTLNARGVDLTDCQEVFGVFVSGNFNPDEPWSSETTVTGTTQLITGLNANTQYEWRVKGVCNQDESSWVSSTFTTLANTTCPPPTDLIVSNISSTSATLNWVGSADSYNVWYGSPQSNKMVLNHDNLTFGYPLGSDTEATWTWGVMFPGSMVTGNVLTAVGFFNTDQNTNDITIRIYSGGDNAPDSLLLTKVVIPTPNYQLVFLDSPLHLVPGQNLWITLEETGKYIINTSYATDPNSRWLKIGETWMQLDGYSETGFAIHGHIATQDYESITWNQLLATNETVELTGLNTETTYVVKVQSHCNQEGDSELSDEITFITKSDDCSMPTELSASNITPSSALVSWSGDVGDYTLRYGIYSPATDSEWLKYDNGIIAGELSFGTSLNWNLGVKYPAAQITGNVLSKVSFFENEHNTAPITIRIYSGGDNEPGKLLYTEVVNSHTRGFHEVTLASPVLLVSGQNLWITIEETGDLIAHICSSSNPNNQWYSIGNGWNSLGGYHGWMIRGYIETRDLWSNVMEKNTTSDEVLLRGLEPHTQYYATVQANCDENKFSRWSNLQLFNTPEGQPCLAPTNLVVTEVTNTSVTLSWTENGTAIAWQICLNGDEANPMDVNTNPCTLTGLTPETKYTAKVCASQDGAYSGWSNEIEFLTVTYCPVPSDLSIDSLTANAARLNWTGTSSSFQVKYRTKAFDSGIFEGFTNINSTPLGWSEKAGWLSDVLDGTSSLTDGSFWDYGYGMHDVFDEHASLYMNSSNFNKWLISPIVALREGSILNFDIAVTSFYPGQTIWFDTNDRFAVVVYDENAATWSILQEWNNTGSPFVFTSISSTGTNANIDLSAYSGKNVRIAFYVERSNNCMDVNFNLDNISISSPVPYSEWQTIIESDTTHTLTGLQPETLYEVEVKGICTESLSLESDTISFWTHGLAPSNLAVNDITYNAATLSWTENGLAYVWQICLNGDETNLIEANTNPYSLTDLAYYSDCAVKVRSLHRGVFSDWSDELIFTTSYILPPTNVTVSDIAYFSVNLTWTENGTATAWQICLNDIDSIAANTNPFTLTDLTPNTEYTVKVRSQQGGYYSSWSDATNFTTPFYCYPPTQLTVLESTLNTTTIGWTDHGTADQWQICINGNQNNLVTVNTNHYVLTNLDAETQYTVKVRAICGETYTDWSDELTFIPLLYCNPPTLSFSNITTNTADLSWTAITGADSYTINLNAPLFEHTYPIITGYTATDGTTGVNDGQNYPKLVDNDRSTKWCAAIGDGISIEFHSEIGFIPTAYILTTGNDNQSYGGRNPKNWVIKAKLNVSDPWTTIAAVTNDNVLQDNNTTDYEFTLNNTNAYRYFCFEVSAVKSGDIFQLGEFRFRGQATSFNVTSTSLHLTDLMPETDYAVKIRCNKGEAVSAWSDEVIFTTPGLPPTNLTVTPKTYSSIALGWTENGTATQWQICLDDDENNPIDAPTNPFTITGLTEQTQYAAKVRACRGGVYTSWSNAKTFTTLPYCPAPTGLSALNITCNSMMLSWNQDGSVNDWQICLNNDETNAITVNTNPYTITGLTQNTSYSVKVRGRNGGENYSDWSNPFYFSTTTFYPAPANLAYNDLTFNSVILNWSQSDNATEWRICLNDDMTNLITVTTNPYTLTSLNPESPYAVKVSAYHDGNFSGWSNEVNFTTPVITPTLTVSDLTQTNAKLNWTATSGASYTVMYNLSDGNLMPILSQDFENGLNSWSFSHNIMETSTTIVDNEHHTGSHCFKFIANYAGTEQFLFTPRFENCHLYEFFYKTNNTDETFRINYYINNALQFSSEEITVNTHGLWQKYSCEIPSNIQSVGICYHPGAPGVLFVDDIVVSAEHIIINTTTNSAQISNLTPETEYTAKVRTKHGNLYSAWSDAVNFTTEMPPTNLTVSNVAETVANFNWTENGTATQWQLCLNNDQANPIPAPTKPFTLTGLTQETHYTAKVRSCHEGVYSAWSGTVDFTTLAYCHAPTDLAVDDITRHSATLSWNANSDSYKVFYRTTGEWILAAENLSETTFTLTELISETQYEACVKGVCNGIESNASASISFTTLLDNSPTLTVCDITCTSAGCFWTEIPGADSYTFSFNDTLEIPVTVGYTATSGTQGNDGENYPNLVDNNKRSKWFVNNNNNGVFGGAYIEFHSRHDFVPTGYVLTTAHDTDSEPNHKGRNPKSWVIKAKLHLNDPWTTIASVTNNYVMQNEPLKDYEFTLNNSTPYRYFRFEVLDVQNTYNHRFQLGEMKFLGYSKNNIYLTDLTPATAYSVKVRAKSGDVYSEWSDVVTFNTFYPTPTNPTVTNIDYFSATMGWTDNAGANHWQICLNGDEDHPIAADANPYTLTGLTQQTNYTAKVRVWQNGNYSPWSDDVSFSTPIYCQAPTDLAVNNIATNSATLNWTGTSDSYKVLYRTTGEWTIEECTGTTYTLTGLEANTPYEVCVKGVCNGIESIASNTVSFQTMLDVAAPTIVVSNITQTTADLDWTASTGADYYTVSLNNSVIDQTHVVTGYTATSGTEGYNTNEDYPNLVDNKRNTKWCTGIGSGIFIEFHSDSIFTPTGYILTTGGDNATAHGRNPKNWVIKAKLNPEDPWTTIDSITNDQVLQDVNTTDFEFSLNNNRAYRYFRFEALAVHSGSTFQLGELRFKGIALTNHLHLTDLIPETEYVVKVRVWQNGSYSHWSDEVHFTTLIYCHEPTDLAVDNITTNSAMLHWNGTSDSYQVLLRTIGGAWTTVIENYTSTSFTLNGLDPQTQYEVCVKGVCDGVESLLSDIVSFITLIDVTPPTLTVSNINTTSADLHWTQISGAESYTVSVNDSIIPDSPTNSLQLTDLLPETDYAVKVRSNIGMTFGEWSDVVNFTTYMPPTNLTVTDYAETTATLSWTEHGNATQWQICLNGDETNLIAVDTNPFTLTELIQQTHYTVKVRDCQEGTNSAWSNEAEFTTLAFCYAPTDLAVDGITSHSAILNWNGTSDSYIVLYRTTDEWMTAVENHTDTSFTLTGLNANTTYQVCVKGVCNGIESIGSNIVSFITALDIVPPTLTVKNLTQTTADLSWTETPGADSYTVSMNGSTIESSNLIFAGYTATEGTAGANSNQGFAKLVDNNRNSKWCTGIGNGIYIEFHHRFSFIPTGYILTTGNDNSSYGGRNPKNWVIKAKLNADDDWTTIATVTNDNVLQDVNTTDFEFALDNNTAYRYFRFEVSAVHSGSTFQLSELRFRGRAANTLPLTNLTPDTDYSVIIRSNFGETSSEWSDPLYFNTYAPPTNLTVNDIDLFSATLGWTEHGTATQWQICLNDNEDNLITVNTNPYTLTGLTSQTHYTAKVRDYQEGAIGIWSNKVGFNTNLDVTPPTPTISNITLTSAVVNWTEMPGATRYLVSLNDSIILDPIITGYTATAGANGYSNNEGYAKLVDNDRSTKWCRWSNNIYIEFNSQQDFIPTGYVLTTGNDTQNNPGRNPKNWVIKAKLHLDDPWTTIDSITNDTVLKGLNKTDFEFAIDNHAFYRYFRFEVSAVQDGGSFQLGEMRFRGRESACSVQLTNLLPETNYSAKVRCNIGGAFTHWSNAVNFITLDGITFFADGYWNEAGNWNIGQIPDVNDDVSIVAQAIIPVGYTAKVNTITINGGALTINDGGQLIHNNAGVTATVEKAITGHGGDNEGGWYFIASPTTTAIVPSDENGLASGEYDLYFYDETASYWRNHKESDNSAYSNFNLNNGQGYLYANETDKTLSFTGTLQAGNNGSHTIGDLSYVCAHENLRGFNLVGNPFACDATIDRPFYIIDGKTVVANTGSTVIPPCTGVMVKANDEGQSVTFTKVSSQQGAKPNQLQLTLSQTESTRSGVSTTTVDNAIVSFRQGNELEKFYFGNPNAKIYIPQGTEEYAIAFSEGWRDMPLNFKAAENGKYTLTVNPEGVELNYLHLIDNLTGADIDLLKTPSYSFDANRSDYESRFRLLFFCNGTDSDDDTFAFFFNGNWIINNEGEATLQLIDMNGRIISSEVIIGACSKKFNVAAGVYVLRLINNNDVKTQKITH